MKLIEQLRGEVVSTSITRLGSTWPARRSILFDGLRGRKSPTRREILEIGNNLSAAFRLKQLRNVRNQAAVSSAGTVWVSLVAIYLNIVLAGTNAIALPRRFVPKCLKAALKVTYRGNAAALESDIDLMVVYGPEAHPMPPHPRRRPKLTDHFEHYCEDHYALLSVTLFQLKTNWNDTAQVPMLWNMIYNITARGQMPANGFSVGSGTYHLHGLKSFGYGFVTVPTQSNLAAFTPTCMPVSRVTGCSAGAYWGQPTRKGVIKSITEYFNHFFNYSKHHFPAPDSLGKAFAAAYAGRNANEPIAVDAFGIACD
jgi:hypothetical protein